MPSLSSPAANEGHQRPHYSLTPFSHDPPPPERGEVRNGLGHDPHLSIPGDDGTSGTVWQE